MSNIRTAPGLAIRAYQNAGGDAWAQIAKGSTPEGKPVYTGTATVTAIVQVNGSTDIYLLTAGHAFYDADINRSSDLKESNNIVGSPPTPPPSPKMIRARNQAEIRWGEPSLRGKSPFAISAGLYHCAGDKLNSVYDAGLAKLDHGTEFNQLYQGLPVIGYDAQLPVPNLKAGEEYRVGTEVRSDLEFVPIFNPYWNGRPSGQLHGVLRCPYSMLNPVNMKLTMDMNGMSGMPLVRVSADKKSVTIIGMFLGKAEDNALKEKNQESPKYEIYQHISVPVHNLSIRGIAVPT